MQSTQVSAQRQQMDPLVLGLRCTRSTANLWQNAAHERFEEKMDQFDDEMLVLEAEEEQHRQYHFAGPHLCLPLDVKEVSPRVIEEGEDDEKEEPMPTFPTGPVQGLDERWECIQHFIRPMAAVRIQAQIRGFLGRRRIDALIEKQVAATHAIQRVGRGFGDRLWCHKQSISSRAVLVRWWRRHKSAIPPSLLATEGRKGSGKHPSNAAGANRCRSASAATASPFDDEDSAAASMCLSNDSSITFRFDEQPATTGDGEMISLQLTATFILQRFARFVIARSRWLTRQARWCQVFDAAVMVQKHFRRCMVRKEFGPILREIKWERQERELSRFLVKAIGAPRLRRQNRRAEENTIERLICQLMIDHGMTIEEAKVRVRQDEEKHGLKIDDEVGAALLSPQLQHVGRERDHAEFCNLRMLNTLNDESSDSEDVHIEEERMVPLKKPIFKARKEVVYNYFSTPFLQVDKTLSRRMAQHLAKQQSNSEQEVIRMVKAYRRKKREAKRKKEQQEEDVRSERSTNASVKSEIARRSKVFSRLAYGDMYK